MGIAAAKTLEAIETRSTCSSSVEAESKTHEDKKPEVLDQSKVVEGEEEGECGFGVFTKEGGCRETFIAWEKCAEGKKNAEDIVEKCYEITLLLHICMMELLLPKAESTEKQEAEAEAETGSKKKQENY